MVAVWSLAVPLRGATVVPVLGAVEFAGWAKLGALASIAAAAMPRIVGFIMLS